MSYRRRAKRRRFAGAIAHYEELAAEIDGMLARDEERGRVVDAMYRSREALLDAIAVSTGDIAQLERKQRAYIGHKDLSDATGWLFENGVSASFGVDYNLLQLSEFEVARMKRMFPRVWTSNERPPDEERART